MNTKATLRISLLSLALTVMAPLAVDTAEAQERTVPEALKPWEDWVTWDDRQRRSPTVYRSADEHITVWPSKLSLTVDQTSGNWNVSVTAFAETWVTLPGSGETWPIDVKVGELPVPVVQRDGRPAVQLAQGDHELSGKFTWDQMPQRIALPREIGILSLTVDGNAVTMPRWDADGHVWLRRVRSEEAEQDLLAARVYRVLEDGIPTQLLTDIEVTVSGKSREESLGWVLPEGFKLSTVISPIPVAVDDQGRMKAQVRAGKWTIRMTAFRTQSRAEVRFPANAEPIVDRELVAFRAKPEFRLAEIEGLQIVDVSQTTFPDQWRELPIYEWTTNGPFQLTEKMRGMGLQRPDGLVIHRQFWLDEDGRSLTFQDRIAGQMQHIWRLDAAVGQQLGAVRIDGEGQLITANQETGAHGVELRSRNLNLEAIGRIDDLNQLSATGWQADVDSLDATFVLPPGWRALAVFGADRVRGDWLTSWSLLDLFLLLIFSLAVFRIWGLPAGVIAFFAFGLAYHEPGSPRMTWLFLLVPVALLKVVPDGAARNFVRAWKYVAVSVLVVNLIPFVAHQIQTAIYPQLEIPGVNYSGRSMFGAVSATYQAAAHVSDMAYETAELASSRSVQQQSVAKKSRFQTTNLALDPQARIQTGPAQPQWSWNIVQCYWDGPVSSQQTIRPVLLSMQMHRILTVIRVLLLALLAAMLLGVRRFRLPNAKPAVAAACFILAFVQPQKSLAQQFPDAQMLQTLRDRLLEPADVFPNAADIARVDLVVEAGRVEMVAEIHAATAVAVPLPGKLPIWSPLEITIDQQPAELVCRKDGYLWVVLPQGVHRVVVVSLLPDVSEWEWTFELKPRRVTVTAPEWNVTGVGRNGVPDRQLLFSRQRQATDGEAAYDQKDFHPLIAVDRHLEIGLVWQVRTEVTRFSPEGKSVSLKIPLLPNESVLTSNMRVQDKLIDVSLSSGQQSFAWTGEIPVGSDIQLSTNENDSWIERWHLVTSPVWNMSQTGLTPVFQADQQNMIPVWQPWPGEQTTLSFNKPESVTGDILTVQRVDHTTSLGSRQRASTLKLDVECSIGSDFEIDIDPPAAISSLTHNGQPLPVRQDGSRLLVPIRPGKQSIEVAWKTDDPISLIVDTGQVTLPVEGSNVTTVIQVPDSRWVLWANGPLRGPAVRFWTILVSAVVIALVLGGLPNSPLRRSEWVLLALGLTQVHVIAALIVVAWLFVLQFRGKQNAPMLRPGLFNLFQASIVFLTGIVLCIFIVIVGVGLLGNPDMFILGNQSTRNYLNWFQPRIANDLPVASVVSVSVWFYRLLMLFWALWLAASLLRWLKWGWNQFSHGAMWKRKPTVLTPATTDAK